MNNGCVVDRFERAFAAYVGASHAVALNSGTGTLHTALMALGVRPGDKVAVPPLTMSATTMAVLHAGGAPWFVDVDPDTWLMGAGDPDATVQLPVSLYGLHRRHNLFDYRDGRRMAGQRFVIDDAAQTLRPHDPFAHFTSYSFQQSKILPLGEGGMLVTNDDDLADRARSFSSLGYEMKDGARIDPAKLKDPAHNRHVRLGWNYRMADAVAQRGLVRHHGRFSPRHGVIWEGGWDRLKDARQQCAALYRAAHDGCPWITPQHVPEGYTHDYWTYAVALESADLWHPFVEAIERHGGERPYAAWKLTYQEPAFRHLAEDGICPVAEDLQPRLVQFQTNDLESAKRNAEAVNQAIREPS